MLALAAALAAGSPLQAQACSVTREDAVKALYIQVMEREGDPGGVSYYASSLAAGQSVRNIVLGFGQSGEYHARFITGQQDSAVVRNLYRTLLARHPDPGAWGWATHGATYGWNWVVGQLVNSQEYTDRFGDRAVPGEPVVAWDCARAGLALEPANAVPVLERDLCLTIAAGSGAAYECGDLRLAHALPTIRTLNKARTPVLLYNSQHADPTPVVGAYLTLPPGVSADRVRATLVSSSGAVLASGEWPAWAAGEERRIALTFNARAKGLGTGVHAYTLQVSVLSGANTVATYSRRAEMGLVNRSNSPYGAGWWVAGLEKIHFLPDGRLFWVGGDGSFRVYRPVEGRSDRWAAAHVVDRPDTLYSATYPHASYERRLPGKVTVAFNGAGAHVATVNRQDHHTRFGYHNDGKLHSIFVPWQPGYTGQYLRYAFEYDPTGTWLNQVTAPDLYDNRSRTVRVGAGTNGLVEWIQDPDQHTVRFSYPSGLWRPESRTDRRMTVTRFWYDKGGKLSSAGIEMQGTGDDINVYFTPHETRGIQSAEASDGIHTLYDGPRLGFCPIQGPCISPADDLTRFWIDRWGAPRRIVNALGQETVLTRGNSRLPALVTRTRAPNGLETTAEYNARGNLVTSTVHNPLGDGRDAPTRYAYENTNWPDFATRVTRPEGDSVRMDYNKFGNRAWMQDGRGDSTRVHFSYDLATHQLTAVQTEAARVRGEQPERFRYTAFGNLDRVTTPLGFYSEHFQDGLGRDTLVNAPVDATRRLKTWTRYDVMGRDTLGVTDGDTTEGDLYVRKEYDEEGNVLTVSRWSEPGSVGKVTRSFKYDRAGRRTSEWGEELSPIGIEYDRAGNALVVTSGNGTVETRYDDLNRPVMRIVPERRHDPVTRSIVSAYNQTTLGADTYPAFSNAASGAFMIPADTTVFRYDPVSGVMVAADNRDAQIRRAYYPNGQLKTDSLRVRTWAEIADGGSFNTHQYVLEYGYDRNGRRAWMEHPDAIEPVNGATGQRYSRQRYGYEPGSGALSMISDVLGLEYTFHYNAEGALVQTKYPGTRTETLTYDADGRRTGRMMTSANYNGVAGLDTISNVDYDFDQRGLVTRAADTGQDPGANGLNTFKYTQLGRVYNARGKGYGSGGGLPATEERYRWDALGNRVGHQQPEHAYETVSEYVRNTTRISSSHPPDGYANSGQPYTAATYDGAGNQVWFSSDNFMANVDSKQQTYQFRLTRSYYGADGRLRASDGNHCYTEYSPGQVGAVCLGAGQLKNETSGAFEWYRYDALGRRIMVRTRRDHNCTNTAECSSSITRFVWDGDQILYEIQAPGGNVSTSDLENDNASGNQYGRVLYTHGPGIDQPLDILRMNHNPPAGYGFDAWGGPYPVLPFGNWRGTFVGGATAQGAKLPCSPTCLVAWPGSRYRAFLERDRAVYQQNWFGSLTTGQENPNGLTYMRNRYYNPITGAFTQTDPIGLAGGLNAYAFADGNPVSYSDPYGLKVEFANNESRRLWRDLERMAARALRSRDQLTRDAGGVLQTMMQHLDRPGTTYLLNVADFGRRLNEHGGAGTGRLGGGTRDLATGRFTPNVFTLIDDNHSSDRYNVPLVLTLAHEIGHAWAINLGLPDIVKPAHWAENATRVLLGCTNGRTSEEEVPRCP